MTSRGISDHPNWDQGTFLGRLKYFFWVTDPRTVVVSNSKLDEAKDLLEKQKRNQHLPGTITPAQILYAQKLYESSFHPDSGQRMNVFGRMSFQVPGGMAITGCLLQFYKTTPQVVFWQWVNQSFNALVNYTNRNAASSVTTKQMGIAYISATTSAVITAVGFKSFLQKRASSLMNRYVPFVAVAAANCVNIPLMRQSELIDGIAVFDANGNKVTESRLAAAKGIFQVVVSRIAMCAPGMLITPIFMEQLEKLDWMKRMKFLHAPMQVLFCGGFLLFMTPAACALFPQRCSLDVSTLKRWEPDSYDKLVAQVKDALPDRVYFNKGL